MVMSTEKKEILYGYPFYQAYLNGKLTKSLTLENIDGFAKDLIKKGFTEEDIKEIKVGIVEPKDFHSKNKSTLFVWVLLIAIVAISGTLGKSSWFFSAIGGSVSLAIMSLLLKKATVKLDNKLILLFVFGIGFIFYLIQAISSKTLPSLEFPLIAGIALAAIFSFLGNWSGLQALRLAPNPGFTRSVGTIGIVITTFASIILFSSHVTPVATLGLTLIIAGIIIFSINPEKTEKKAGHYSQSWIFFAILGALMITTMSIINKILLLELSSPTVLFYLFGFVTIYYLFMVVKDKSVVSMNLQTFSILFCAAFMSFIGNILGFNAIQMASNIGFVVALDSSTKIIALTWASIYLFDSKMSNREKIASAVTVAGVVIFSMFNV